MSVYVDPALWKWRGKVWCHMLADTEEELHVFAKRLGLKREWHQKPGRYDNHYDLTASKRETAIAMGAIPIDRKRLVQILTAKRETMKPKEGSAHENQDT